MITKPRNILISASDLSFMLRSCAKTEFLVAVTHLFYRKSAVRIPLPKKKDEIQQGRIFSFIYFLSCFTCVLWVDILASVTPLCMKSTMGMQAKHEIHIASCDIRWRVHKALNLLPVYCDGSRVHSVSFGFIRFHSVLRYCTETLFALVCRSQGGGHTLHTIPFLSHLWPPLSVCLSPSHLSHKTNFPPRPFILTFFNE